MVEDVGQDTVEGVAKATLFLTSFLFNLLQSLLIIQKIQAHQNLMFDDFPSGSNYRLGRQQERITMNR
jgi:hypothetical protein